jgi:hypothetical protein
MNSRMSNSSHLMLVNEANERARLSPNFTSSRQRRTSSPITFPAEPGFELRVNGRG